MSAVNKGQDVIAITVYLLFSIFVFWWGTQHPRFNWDMLAYVGSALALESKDADTIHDTVFSNLREHVGDVEYKRLTRAGNPYRSVMAKSPELFMAQLPFYKPRIVYISAILFLGKMGVDIFHATYLLSAFFAAASVMLVLMMATRYLSHYCVLILPLFMLAFGVLNVAALSTPDALAMFFVLLSSLLISRGRGAVLLLLPLSVLVRTDLIIWSAVLIVFLLWAQAFSVWKVVAAAAVMVSAYMLINAWSGNYGWQVTFYLTLVLRELDPRLLSSPLTLWQYFQALANGMAGILKNVAFLVFAAMSALSVVNLRREPVRPTREDPRLIMRALFILLPILYVLMHFMLFPVMWTRFFIGHYCLACLGFLWMSCDSSRGGVKPV